MTAAAETVWLTQKQIADALGTNVTTVNHHIKTFERQYGDKANRSIEVRLILTNDGKMHHVKHYHPDVVHYILVRQQTKSPQKFIYLLRAPRLSRFKIGCATNVKQRCSAINTASPCEVVLVAYFATNQSRKIEAALHQKYARFHVKGEWFELGKNQVQELLDTFHQYEESNSHVK